MYNGLLVVTGPLLDTLASGSGSGVTCTGSPGVVLPDDPWVGVEALLADVQIFAVEKTASPLVKAPADFLPAPCPRPCTRCISDFCQWLVAAWVWVGRAVCAAVGLAQSVLAACNGSCPSREGFVVQPGVER